MTKISAFKAIVYNQEKIKDLSKAVCPPYDIISQKKQKSLHDLSPYNLVHLELGEDIAGEDKYVRAAELFNEWLKEKILLQDECPGIYFYNQQYYIEREKRSRFGFIALLKLDENGNSVFGHEHTHLEPKEDRLKLIRQVKANLSPIFVIFRDKKRITGQVWNKHIKNKKPFIEVTDDEKTLHQLWRLDDKDVLAAMQAAMEKENIFIADGHHRYEVACAYRDEAKKTLPGATGEEGFNYVMAYFTYVDSLGLTILPIHRLVRLPENIDTEILVLKLREYFYVEEIKDRVDFFFLIKKAGRSEHVLGMYYKRKHWLLRLRNIKLLEKINSDKPIEYRSLDVSILNGLVLEKILSLDPQDKSCVTFCPDSEELIGKCDSDNSYLAFFLNSTKIEQVVSVALKGEKMPPKSTYFYPKVLSGLVIHKHE
jgi:uncharacterized protein (DUF1015 family)